MNGKKAKLFRRLAKAIANENGIPDVSYSNVKYPDRKYRFQWSAQELADAETTGTVLGPFKIVSLPVTRRVMEFCERSQYKRLKRTYTNLKREDPLFTAQQFVQRAGYAKVVQKPVEQMGSVAVG